MGTVLPISVEVLEEKTVVPVLGLMKVKVPQHRELLETLYHDKLSGWLESGIIKVSIPFFAPTIASTDATPA